MKILIIYDNYNKKGGGSQLAALRWFENLNNLGVTTYLLKNKSKDEIGFFKEKIIEVPSVDLSFFLKNTSFSLFFTKEAIEKIKSSDIILINEPTLLSFLVSISKDFLFKKKIVFIFHTNYDYFLKELKTDNLTSYLIKSFSPFLIFFRNSIIQNSDSLIFVSKNFKKIYEKKIKKRSYYLTIPVNKKFFKKFKIKKKEPHSLVYFGRLTKEKRVEILIRMMSLLKKRYKLFIVGDGFLKEKLEELVYDLGLQEDVEFLGWIENNNLRDFLENFDFFVSASNFEVFAFVYLESLLSGLPAFVYDYPSSREAIPENCGVFIKSDKPEVWAKNLLKYKNRESFINLQKNILKSYNKFLKFHEEASSKKLIKICESLLTESS